VGDIGGVVHIVDRDPIVLAVEIGSIEVFKVVFEGAAYGMGAHLGVGKYDNCHCTQKPEPF
jgi:hypothetical protein